MTLHNLIIWIVKFKTQNYLPCVVTRLMPSRHVHRYLSKRSFFYVFWPFVHTQMQFSSLTMEPLENSFKGEDIQKLWVGLWRGIVRNYLLCLHVQWLKWLNSAGVNLVDRTFNIWRSLLHNAAFPWHRPCHQCCKIDGGHAFAIVGFPLTFYIFQTSKCS